MSDEQVTEEGAGAEEGGEASAIKEAPPPAPLDNLSETSGLLRDVEAPRCR